MIDLARNVKWIMTANRQGQDSIKLKFQQYFIEEEKVIGKRLSKKLYGETKPNLSISTNSISIGQASDSHTIQSHLLSIFDNTASVKFGPSDYNKIQG